MGFNIGGIIAGAAKGATATMRNRMNAHEKTLAEEKRLRTSAEIQADFEEKSAEKKEKRQAPIPTFGGGGIGSATKIV